MERHAFPFSALVGQEQMKLALVLNAINPALGGVLIRGEKGTAKSTLVRALATLLPEIAIVEGCAFGCDPDDRERWCSECVARATGTLTETGRDRPSAVPKTSHDDGTVSTGNDDDSFVARDHDALTATGRDNAARTELPRVRRHPRLLTLPLGATEDRLLGTLDIERALTRGERRFEPGLLARVNRGILYVDEVNLLEDHIVDLLLDAAAMGVNVIEREGVSFVHPAEFLRALPRVRSVLFDATQDGKNDIEALRLAEALGAVSLKVHRLRGLTREAMRHVLRSL